MPFPGEVNVICGGPPCQGISGNNRHAQQEDILKDVRGCPLPEWRVLPWRCRRPARSIAITILSICAPELRPPHLTSSCAPPLVLQVRNRQLQVGRGAQGGREGTGMRGVSGTKGPAWLPVLPGSDAQV